MITGSYPFETTSISQENDNVGGLYECILNSEMQVPSEASEYCIDLLLSKSHFNFLKSKLILRRDT